MPAVERKKIKSEPSDKDKIQNESMLMPTMVIW